MTVQSKIFRSTFSSWESMCEEAGQFATSVGRELLISISHSHEHGQGVIIVWYWA
jgi:hypothetical protein